MKLYQLIIATVAFFQPFSCISMEMTEYTFGLPPRPTPKKYYLPDESTGLNIPPDLEEYFNVQPPIKLPEKSKTAIVAMCIEKQKSTPKSDAQLAVEKEKILNEVVQHCYDLEKENKRLKKEHAARQETIKRDETDLALLKQNIERIQKQKEIIQACCTTTISFQNNCCKTVEAPAREQWQIEKNCFWKQISEQRNCRITQRKHLLDALKELCLDIADNTVKNKLEGPYFDRSVHLLVVPIEGKNCTCIYSPCTSAITIRKELFSVLTDKPIAIGPDFLCLGKCKFSAYASSCSSDDEACTTETESD